MIKRASMVGLFTGLLLSLAGFYPAVSLIVPIFFPDIPKANDLVHGLLLMASAAIGVPIFFSVGMMAVKKSEVRGLIPGAKVGIVAGVVTAVFCYITLISPLNAIAAYSKVLGYIPTPVAPLPPVESLHAYAKVFQDGIYLFELTIAASVLCWGLQGAFVGWRRRSLADPEPTPLYSFVKQGYHPRHWLRADNESSIRAGVLVGSVVGWLSFITMAGQSYLILISDWPELEEILRETQLATVIGLQVHVLPILWPIIMLGLLTFGGLVIAMSKNPASRFWARLNGVLVASHIIFAFFTAILLRLAYLQLGLAPFSFHRQLQMYPDMFTDAPMWAKTFILTLLSSPLELMIGTLMLPWLILTMTFLTSLVVGGSQAIFYGALIPMIHPQPIDKAVVLARQIKQTPEEVLPTTYHLFSSNPDAYDVLAHLVTKTYRDAPQASELIAACHTLGTAENDRACVNETVGCYSGDYWTQSHLALVNRYGRYLPGCA